ncbi:MAG: WbqC family protein [Sedimentisphaerales bacterium]
MRCAVMQPTYIPWLGYFDLIDSVDKFVFLDDVKLEKCSWHVRNRIKTPQGELYLTIPIRKTVGRDKLIINEALINNEEPWREKHLKSIFCAYRKSVFFNDAYPFTEELVNSEAVRLCDFTVSIITRIANKIGIDKEFILVSNMKNLSGQKDTRLVSICKEISCEQYLSPQGSAVYIERDSPGGEFVKNGIELFYHNYEHPVYSQLYGGFLPYMSVIDLLFNCGFEKSLEIIRSGRREPVDYLTFRTNILNIGQV